LIKELKGDIEARDAILSEKDAQLSEA